MSKPNTESAQAAAKPPILERARKWLRGLPRSHQLFLLAKLLCVAFACYFWQYLPTPGIAIAFAGFVAVLMSLQPEMAGWQKAIWLVLIVGLTVIEIRAITRDREENDAQQARILEEQRNSFKVILDTTRDSFERMLKQQQTDFDESQENYSKTMTALLNSQRTSEREFGKMLDSVKGVFDRQEQLARSMSGELIPASDPMPTHNCESLNSDESILIMAGNAYPVRVFPYTVLQVRGRRAIVLDRSPNGVMTAVLDLRDAQGRIIVRLNNQGYTINRNAILGVRTPDRSTLLVDDEFGNEILNLRVLNTRAVSIRGTLIEGLVPNIRGSCLSGGQAAIIID